MATAARLADVGGVHGRRGVARFDDLVLAVAIGAERGLHDALGQGLEMCIRDRPEPKHAAEPEPAPQSTTA